MQLTYRIAASEDCQLFFDWANEPEVRQNAFNSEPIVYEQHKQWFENKLAADDSVLFVFYLGFDAVGQIRLDEEGRHALIDYSIDPHHRDKGLGSEMLQAIALLYKKTGGKIVKGVVKAANIPSCKAFEKAGFELVETTSVNDEHCKIYEYKT